MFHKIPHRFLIVISSFQCRGRQTALAATELHSKCLHTTANLFARKKIPFEFVRSPYVPAVFKSGDNETIGLQNMDMSVCLSKFRGSKELEDADETVKKMCSLRFATRGEVIADLEKSYVERVKRNDIDIGSIECHIARLTCKIRSLQEALRINWKNSRGRVKLKHAIDRRNKLFRHLRQQDYGRFEWILQELNIEYKRPARFYYYETRKGVLRDMVQKYCDDIRVSRLQELKDKLKAQQEAFLKEKEEKLRFIAQEEVALGLRTESDVSDVVVESEAFKRKPPPVENTMVRVARTAEGKVVYSVPTWPPRREE